jgi:chromosome segregation protein
MRLRQLDLIRYGKFHEQVLDFGAAGRDCDVTVVFGENEAGKSTAFAAWLDLLFGLPMQTAHAFRFDRKDMMVGATIEAGGDSLTLRRTGKRQDSLTDAHGRVVDEARLSALLHGLDRDSYAKRFSLDDAVLREGGEEIARAQGDLGRLLHAGTSGLSGISEAMTAVEAEVDGFHKKSGRKTTLAAAKKDLADLEQAIQAARVEPRHFADLRKAQATAAAELAAAKAACAAAQRAVIVREAAERRRAIAAAIAVEQDKLAAAPAGPDLPEDALSRVVAADERRLAAEQHHAEAVQEGARLEAEAAALAPDAEGLAVAEALATLEIARFDDGELLLPRVQTAAADIGRRRAEAAQLLRDTTALAERIAGPGAQDVALPEERRMALRASAQAVRDGARQLADLDLTRQETQAALGPDLAMPQGIDALSDALLALQRDTSDPVALADAATRAGVMAARAAAGLSGDWRALAEAGLPEEAELAELATRSARLAERASDAARQLAEAEEALAAQEAALTAARDFGAAVTDGEIAESRAARDAAWAEHETDLQRATAARFADLMRGDDALRTRHAASAEGRLRLTAAREQVQQEQQRCARRSAAVARCDEEQATLQAEAAAMAGRLGLGAEFPVAGFVARRAALRTALDLALEAEAAATLAAQARARRDILLGWLSDAVQGAGGVSTPERLQPEAERLLAQLEARAKEARARQAAAASLASLNHKRDAAEQALSLHRAALARVATGWAEGMDAEAILARLPDLDRLAQVEVEHADRARRIGLMEAALAAFEAVMQPLRPALGLADAASVSETLAAARQRAKAAEAGAAQISALARKREAARAAQGAAEQVMRASAAEIALVLEGQESAPEANPRRHVSTLVARDRDRATLQRLRAEHALAAGGLDEAALEAEAQQVDPARLAGLQADLAEAEAQRDGVLRRAGEADEALRLALASTGGADIDQRRATALETLREEARIAATKLLGLMAAQGALRRFRQEHRGDMLEATEAAFARLTHGEWPRLETQSTGKSERLVALRDGLPVTADAMSTGTRGQLYLALRIAGHADFVARHGPLPFVTDDIHETFDDMRSRAALELAGEMGKLGQAILFTHHRHLVTLARDVLGDVRVIELAK